VCVCVCVCKGLCMLLNANSAAWQINILANLLPTDSCQLYNHHQTMTTRRRTAATTTTITLTTTTITTTGA